MTILKNDLENNEFDKYNFLNDTYAFTVDCYNNGLCFILYCNVEAIMKVGEEGITIDELVNKAYENHLKFIKD